VAGLQARNNRRVVISGSSELFSDKFFTTEITGHDGKTSPSGNQQFASELARWTFGERGQIRIKSITHHLEGQTEQKTSYTIKDQFVCTVNMEVFNGNEWEGFSTSDLQLELQMLDPYVRKTFVDQGNGKFVSAFMLPDVYGVFTLKVDYNRVGFTSISHRETLTILPFRHTDYERFIISGKNYLPPNTSD
jgi:oligosaccharyltransferase complex subunit beta